MSDKEWVLIGNGTAVCKEDFLYTDHYFIKDKKYNFSVNQHIETGMAMFEVTASSNSQTLLPGMEPPQIIILRQTFEDKFNSLKIVRKNRLNLILGEQISDLFL